MQPRSSRYLAIARYSSGSEMFARYITWSMTTYMPGLPFASTAAACKTRRAFSGIPQTSDKIPLHKHDPAAEGGCRRDLRVLYPETPRSESPDISECAPWWLPP